MYMYIISAIPCLFVAINAAVFKDDSTEIVLNTVRRSITEASDIALQVFQIYVCLYVSITSEYV